MSLYEARQHLREGVVYSVAGAEPEHGTIERVSLDYVFVRYAHGVKAAHARDLTLLRQSAEKK